MDKEDTVIGNIKTVRPCWMQYGMQKSNGMKKFKKVLAKQWSDYREDLVRLGEIQIPRWIQLSPNEEVSLHGFCDGSDDAYSAVVYVRVSKEQKVVVTLMAAKTRVAPKKKKLTTPKIELCGAVLLASLMKKMKTTLNMEKVSTHLWSDSMITLGCIAGNPGRWKPFVSNRVEQIQRNEFPSTNWNYVNTSDNPADCASRGIMPNQLKNHPLWWEGPRWLKNDQSTWDRPTIPEHQLES
ncbi:hypothetical protein HA402_001975 [Bradysia odoriphaga]|nr:hypothetical protein HA402_001975 [Bradysia odoriphaga]